MKKRLHLWLAALLALCLALTGSAGAAEGETAATASQEEGGVPADGEYAPGGFAFAWNGGSGKTTISCSRVEVKDGAVSATIEFSSEHYTYVKIGSETCDEPDHSQGTSIFVIPVEWNAENVIAAETTAMSQPHEIEYTLYFGDAGTEPSWAQSETAAADGAETAETAGETEKGTADTGSAPELPDLTCSSVMELSYASCFDVYYYNDGYKLLDIHDKARYLVVPEGKEAPQGLEEDIVVLQQPLDRIYLAATAVMSLFDSLDALDALSFSGTDADGWYIENASAAMEEGEILYAGKYSEPDYELLVDGGCDLAIESTMILHTPKVQEMIEDLGIPVLTDYSSYESHPLGRTEWIKFYGALLNKEDVAEEFFDRQAQVVEELEGFQNTEKTVAFFYVSTDGTVVVRSSSDYVPKMIEIAGGRYIFQDLYSEEGQKSSVSLTMEEFYSQAIDADYLIYNATIDNPIGSISDLLEKSELFADFKAVQNGNVWCCGKYLYQATDIVGTMIGDFHKMLTDGNPEDMTFLTKIDQ